MSAVRSGLKLKNAPQVIERRAERSLPSLTAVHEECVGVADKVVVVAD